MQRTALKFDTSVHFKICEKSIRSTSKNTLSYFEITVFLKLRFLTMLILIASYVTHIFCRDSLTELTIHKAIVYLLIYAKPFSGVSLAAR